MIDVPTGPRSTYDRLGQFSGTRLSIPSGAPFGTARPPSPPSPPSPLPPTAIIGGGRLLSFYDVMPLLTESFVSQPTFAAAAPASIAEIVIVDGQDGLCPLCRRPH